MKALKYGLTLILGLSMLGFGTRLQAQVASGQTAEVVPATPVALPEVPPADEDNGQEEEEEQPQRGMVTPKPIEDMVSRGEYAQAVVEFEKYMKTASGDPCDLLYLPYSFYDRLQFEDTANSAAHQETRDKYLAKFFKTCSNSPEVYVLKDRMSDPRTPESTLEYMNKALAIDPSYGQLYSMRGDALWALGRKKEACADFEKSKELINDSYSKRFLDENCTEKTGNTAE